MTTAIPMNASPRLTGMPHLPPHARPRPHMTLNLPSHARPRTIPEPPHVPVIKHDDDIT